MLPFTTLRVAPLRRLVTGNSSRLFTTKRHIILPPSGALSQPRTPSAQPSASFATSAEATVNQNFAAVATGGIPYPGFPKIEDPYQKRQWQLEHMAGAFRVFARMGFTEGAAGHISVRDPVDPTTFWINPLVHLPLRRTASNQPRHLLTLGQYGCSFRHAQGQ